MQKRVLIADENDTIRGVAETVLRQNGYEVISVAAADKALEILDHSLPHLMLVSGSLVSSDGRPAYEMLHGHQRAASVPMLVLGAPGQEQLPLPAETVLPQPFDPQVLMRRVTAVMNQPADQTAAADNPLGEASLDEDFLDAALGLDDIHVTESEDMDKTASGKTARNRIRRAAAEATSNGKNLDQTGSTKIESLILSDDATDIQHSSDARDKAKRDVHITSGIDIVSDQYGLSDPNAFKPDDDHQAHDYHWFVNSMQEEHGQGDDQASPGTGNAVEFGAEELQFTDQASIVDPITPGPGSSGSNESRSGGVDKFINEFKKEIEKIRSDEPEVDGLQQSSAVPPTMAAPAPAEVVWEDKIEKLSPEHMELFSKRLMTAVADRIAARLTAQLDPEKLLDLIKTELIAYLKDKKDKS